MQEVTLSSHYFRSVLSHAEKHQLSKRRLLQEAGISPHIFSNRSARITASQYAKLQTLTMLAMNDEMLGYASRPLPNGSWSVLCHWLLSCNTLGDALKRLAQFFNMLEKGLKLDFHHRGSLPKLMVSEWQPETIVEPYGYEFFLYGIHRTLGWLIDGMPPIQSLHVPYDLPHYKDEYRLLFPRTQVHFNSPSCELVFNKQALRTPINRTKKELADFLENPMLSIITYSYNEKSWTGRVQTRLRQDLEELPTFADMAKHFDMSTKQLRRELEAEGISYSDLKSQLRRDVAIKYLTETKKTIEQIAALTGFSETSTFTRAFKQWTRMSPSEFRKSEA